MTRKQEQHAAIRERAADAIRNMYHNATPSYPRDVPELWQDYFQDWFNDTATFEIEYLQDGGAYGKDYRKTLSADCNAGRYKSERTRAYYVRKGMREQRHDLAHPERAWQAIGEYGKLYSWGRGGRTLAPDSLIKQRGGSSFSVREDYADDMPIAAVVELTRIVESFNRYVESWCESVPEQWSEQQAELEAEACAETVGGFADALAQFARVRDFCVNQ
jgi:hypothetical protein